MHIFIDESGNFTRREDGTSAISAVGALVIKDSAMAGFRKLYGRLRKRLPKDGKEVKGRLLNEAEVAQVCKVLKTVGAIFEVVATDLALQSDEEIEKHQSVQAEKITENLTDEFSDDFKEEVWDLRKQLEAHPKQLYLQSVCMSELIHSTLNHADVYHSLRFPRELGSYTWRIDAKGRDGKTNWEEWWEQTLLPILESKSVREPFMRIESGDYSA